MYGLFIINKLAINYKVVIPSLFLNKNTAKYITATNATALTIDGEKPTIILYKTIIIIRINNLYNLFIPLITYAINIQIILV